MDPNRALQDLLRAASLLGGLSFVPADSAASGAAKEDAKESSKSTENGQSNKNWKQLTATVTIPVGYFITYRLRNWSNNVLILSRKYGRKRPWYERSKLVRGQLMEVTEVMAGLQIGAVSFPMKRP